MHLEAARKDSAVHVSLSPIHFSNSPGPEAPSPETGDSINRRSGPNLRQLIGSLVTISSEVLRKARLHAEAVRRASGGYIFGGPFHVNTITTKKIALRRNGSRFQQMGPALDSASQLAVAPYSGHIPRPCCPIGESSRA